MGIDSAFNKTGSAITSVAAGTRNQAVGFVVATKARHTYNRQMGKAFLEARAAAKAREEEEEAIAKANKEAVESTVESIAEVLPQLTPEQLAKLTKALPKNITAQAQA